MNDKKIKIAITSAPNVRKPVSPKGFMYAPEEVTPEEFQKYVVSGYAFAHIFKFDKTNGRYRFYNTEKKLENFISADIVFLDIDDSPINPKDLDFQLKEHGFSPLMIYTTYSHRDLNKCHHPKYSNRFRLVYLLEESITDTNDYKHCVMLLEAKLRTINPQLKVDDKAKNVAQCFYGYGRLNEHKYQSLNTGCVLVNYEKLKDDFKDIKKEVHNTKYCKPVTYEEYKKQFSNNELLNSVYGNTTTNPFNLEDESERKFFITRFSDLYVTPRTWIKLDTTQEFMWINKPYYELKRRYRNYYDGMHRKYNLFIWGIYRRLIKPSITFDEMFVSMVFDAHNYLSFEKIRTIITKDGKTEERKQELLTITNILQKTNEVMAADLRTYTDKKSKSYVKPKYEFSMPTNLKPKKGWQRRMRTWQNEEIIKRLEANKTLSYENYKEEMIMRGLTPISYKQFRFEYLKEKNLVDIGVMTNDKLISMFYDKGIKPSECYRQIKEKYGDNPDIKIPCKRTVERYYEKMANLFDNQRKSCTFAV